MLFVALERILTLCLFAFVIVSHPCAFSLASFTFSSSENSLSWRISSPLFLVLFPLLNLRHFHLNRPSFSTALLFTRLWWHIIHWTSVTDHLSKFGCLLFTELRFFLTLFLLRPFSISCRLRSFSISQCSPMIVVVSSIQATIVRFVVQMLRSDHPARDVLLIWAMLMV